MVCAINAGIDICCIDMCLFALDDLWLCVCVCLLDVLTHKPFELMKKKKPIEINNNPWNKIDFYFI